MIKIRRRKPIFEDDQTIQQQPSATGTTAQPAATPAPANNTTTSAAPIQPQQPAQQPAQPQTNVNAGLKAAYSFRKNLMENLEIANKKKYYNSVCEDYFDKTEFTL